MKGLGAELVPPDMQQQCRILFENSAGVDAMWASQPQTVLHGDPHLGNLFFEGDEPGFLDWQVSMAGAGIRDVAYFATASVDSELLRTIERGLVERYAAGSIAPASMWMSNTSGPSIGPASPRASLPLSPPPRPERACRTPRSAARRCLAGGRRCRSARLLRRPRLARGRHEGLSVTTTR